MCTAQRIGIAHRHRIDLRVLTSNKRCIRSVSDGTRALTTTSSAGDLRKRQRCAASHSSRYASAVASSSCMCNIAGCIAFCALLVLCWVLHQASCNCQCMLQLALCMLGTITRPRCAVLHYTSRALAACSMQHAADSLQHAADYMQRTTCTMQRTPGTMQHSTYAIQYTPYNHSTSDMQLRLMTHGSLIQQCLEACVPCQSTATGTCAARYRALHTCHVRVIRWFCHRCSVGMSRVGCQRVRSSNKRLQVVRQLTRVVRLVDAPHCGSPRQPTTGGTR